MAGLLGDVEHHQPAMTASLLKRFCRTSRTLPPPSAAMAAPVTNAEASDSNQAAVSPISAGSPYRPIGWAVLRNSACEDPFSTTDISIGEIGSASSREKRSQNG